MIAMAAPVNHIARDRELDANGTVGVAATDLGPLARFSLSRFAAAASLSATTLAAVFLAASAFAASILAASAMSASAFAVIAASFAACDSSDGAIDVWQLNNG